MNFRNTALATVLVAMLSTAIAHEGHRHPEQAASKESGPSISLSPLAARFELTVNRTPADWYLWRESDVIETANSVTGQNDIWRRERDNDYTYRRVFHPERRVVDYAAGEIRTRHAEPDWAKLASVISPQLLRELKRGSSKMLFGQKAVRYSGTVGGQSIDLWWLETAGIPARLHLARPGQRMTLALRELHASAPAAWPRATEARIADYGLIDAADFGDMESDPFVARVMQQDGHHHAH